MPPTPTNPPNALAWMSPCWIWTLSPVSAEAICRRKPGVGRFSRTVIYEADESGGALSARDGHYHSAHKQPMITPLRPRRLSQHPDFSPRTTELASSSELEMLMCPEVNSVALWVRLEAVTQMSR